MKSFIHPPKYVEYQIDYTVGKSQQSEYITCLVESISIINCLKILIDETAHDRRDDHPNGVEAAIETG